MKRVALLAAILVSLAPLAALNAVVQAADEPASQCLAIAQNIELPRVMFASMTASPLIGTSNDGNNGNVKFEFSGHSTWRITSPEGVTIATDFSGIYGATPTPLSNHEPRSRG